MADPKLPYAHPAPAPAGGDADTGRGAGRGAFAALVAGNVALALGPLFVRMADVGPVAAGFWRLALALPLLLFFARHRIAGAFGPAGFSRIGLFAALAGLFFALDLASWHLGIVRTKMANAVLFGNSASLLLVLYGILLARRLPGRWQAAAVLLAFAGGALMMGESFEIAPQNLVGDLLSLTAGALYTGYIIAMGRARGELDQWSALAVASAAGLLPLLGLAVLLDERLWPTDWMPVMLLALSSQIVGQGLLIRALPYFPPLVIGLVLLVQPAFGALVGWLAYGEWLSPLELAGGVMVAAALVLVRR